MASPQRSARADGAFALRTTAEIDRTWFAAAESGVDASFAPATLLCRVPAHASATSLRPPLAG